MRIMTFAFPVRETIAAELRFPSDLSSDELDDLKQYLYTFFAVERRRIERKIGPSQSPEQAGPVD